MDLLRAEHSAVKLAARRDQDPDAQPAQLLQEGFEALHGHRVVQRKRLGPSVRPGPCLNFMLALVTGHVQRRQA